MRVYTVCMSPTLNGSSALEHFKRSYASLHSVYEPHTLNGSSALVKERFERSYAIKICNEIMFDFYLGLPHVIVWGRNSIAYLVRSKCYSTELKGEAHMHCINL